MENIFSDRLLPIAIAVITLGMGLSINASDFRKVFTQPKALTIGICCQMILLPGIAFLIATFSDIDPVYKVGLIIISACPGGASSNLITYLLNGNVALSISMTVLNSLITLITIPIVVSLGIFYFTSAEADISLPIGLTIIKIFLVTILPAGAGVSIRHYFHELADKLQKPLHYLLPALLLTIYAGVLFIDEGEESSQLINSLYLLPYPLLLNFISMIAGWGVARIFLLRKKNQFTISIEVGLQNSALAIFVAATILQNHSMALIPVIYGAFSFFTTALFGYGVKKCVREG
ncbi:MAG: bile acid:sodium symporter family protein [Bacteroidales bacterium]|nr:bile acid:sodium symporter family protein [Bacteroidales bacterium]